MGRHWRILGKLQCAVCARRFCFFNLGHPLYRSRRLDNLPGVSIKRTDPTLNKTGWLTAVSSPANKAWIFFWHYGRFGLTLVAMGVLLVTLIAINLRLDIGRRAFSNSVIWLISIPRSNYLGWIAVAAISSPTPVLDKSGQSG